MKNLRCIPILLVLGAPAFAETTNCTQITTLPMTVSGSGIYCLKSNLTIALTTNTPAITISGTGVVLDLNGWKLANSSGTGSYGVGVRITGTNVSVVNGTISNFQTGVVIAGTTNTVEGLTLVGNQTGVLIGTSSCCDRSVGYVVKHNYISSGGSTTANGIYVGLNATTGVIVENSTDSGVANGIYFHGGGLFVIVDNNRLSAGSYGLYFDSTGQAVIRNNVSASAYGNHLTANVIDAGGNF